MKILRTNLVLFLFGLISIFASICVCYFITESRNIRLYGMLAKGEIIGFYGRLSRPRGGIYVDINDKTYYSNGYYKSYSIGDTVDVRIVENNNQAIQANFDPKRYYLFYFLDCILLSIGLLLIRESIKGKRLWRY